jgi:hypothetical protein
MDSQFLNPDNKDFLYSKRRDRSSLTGADQEADAKRDEDLIIEDNTVYEIDRECYERLKGRKRRKQS